jgi:hypothetical protein
MSVSLVFAIGKGHSEGEFTKIGGVRVGLRSQVPVYSIKRKVKKKHLSRGWNFSTFAAHLIEQDLF